MSCNPFDALAKAWALAPTAPTWKPVSAGEYMVRIVGGNHFTAKNGTPGYRLTLEVVDGPQAGRRFTHVWWLTTNGLPVAKRDLGKLGFTEFAELERPVQPSRINRVRVGVRKGENGESYNRLTWIDPVFVGQPHLDAFAPAPRQTDDRLDELQAICAAPSSGKESAA